MATALLMSACQSAPTGLLSPDSLYPEAITSCADEPAVPPRPADGSPRPDKDKADYVNGLHGAWADCHDTVDATRQRKALYAKQYEAAKPGLHFPNPFAKKGT